MKKIIAVILIFSIFSCQKKIANDDQTIVKVDLDSSDERKYSSVFSDVSYVLLESKPGQTLISPKKIYKLDKRIFISTPDENLFIFDEDGSIINVIESLGEGAGQLRVIDDFQVKDDQIIIKDGFLKKTLYYDLSGKFLFEKKDILLESNFFFGNGFKLFYTHNSLDYGKSRIIRIADGGEIEGFLSFYPGIQQRVYFSNGFYKIRGSDELFFALPLTYQLAYFTTDGFLKNTIKFDFGNYEVKDSDRGRFEDRMAEYQFIFENNLIDNFSSAFPISEDAFMISVKPGSQSGRVIIGNRKGEILFNSETFTNDFLEVSSFMIPWTFSDEKVVFWSSLDYLKQGSLNDNSDDFSKFLNLVPKVHENWDNESIILIFGELKEDFKH